MLILEPKVKAVHQQFATIDKSTCMGQFVQDKALRWWMFVLVDECEGYV